MAARTKWLHRTPEPNARRRLFCLPYSGCGASMYRHWPRYIGDAEVCPVQPPGRENRFREPAYSTNEELAVGLLAALGEYMDVPYALFGHCGSALGAFESAVTAARTGASMPVRTFVSSHVAPHDGPYGSFLTMSDPELAEELRTLFRLMGGEPPAEIIELTLEVLRVDLEANRRYSVAEPFPAGFPITTIGWSDDRAVPHALMSGWSAYGAVDHHVLDGGHYRFLNAPADLRDVLGRVW